MVERSKLSNLTGRIKTLLLQRINNWYGACFGMLRQPLRPATAAAAIDGRNKKQKIQKKFIAPSSIAAIINMRGSNLGEGEGFYFTQSIICLLYSIFIPSLRRMMLRFDTSGSRCIREETSER